MAQKSTGMGGGDHTKGGSNPTRSDRTGVAMVQDPTVLSQQRNAVIHQPLRQQTIFVLKSSGYTGKLLRINRTGRSDGGLHPVQGPAQIDGSGS